MKYSLSFLGNEESQIPDPGKFGNIGVEAVLFNGNQLFGDSWDKLWKNIETACDKYSSSNVTFHFPMNNADYINNPDISKKLEESYLRACNLGLKGMVVHSNSIKTVSEWKNFEMSDLRTVIFDKLNNVRSQCLDSKTWLGLENMPYIGNFGFETDPLFCVPTDFLDLPASLTVVWDFCHAMITNFSIEQINNGGMPAELATRNFNTGDTDIDQIVSKIGHIHFSAFRGVNNLVDKFEEGILPTDTPNEKDYQSILEKIKNQLPDVVINFEVVEEDYLNRQAGPSIIQWSDNYLNS